VRPDRCKARLDEVTDVSDTLADPVADYFTCVCGAVAYKSENHLCDCTICSKSFYAAEKVASAGLDTAIFDPM
jgi:hypothetical protein